MPVLKDTVAFMEKAGYHRETLQNGDLFANEDAFDEVLAKELLHFKKRSAREVCVIETSASPYIFNFDPITGEPYGTCNP